MFHWLKKFGGISRVAIVAVFAGFLAMQAVVALIGTSITGIVGTGQDTETKLHHWDWATQWSLPKAETFGLVVPGLFGYKLDTPKDMMPILQNAYKGGEYWGGVGRDPAIDRYFDNGRQGEQPPGFMRFTGGGNYLGILVVLLVAFAVAQSFRRENSPFAGSAKTVHLVLGRGGGRFAAAVVGPVCAGLLQDVLRPAVCVHHPQPGQIRPHAGVGNRDFIRLRRPRLEPALFGSSRRKFRGGFRPAHQLVGKSPRL